MCDGKKRFGLSLVLVALYLFLFSLAASAQDVIKVTVTADDVDICSEPGTKGTVYAQAYEGQILLVESAPVRGKDNSTWYKIIFLVSEEDGSIIQVQKDSDFEFSNPYINAKFVKKVPLDEDLQKELDYFNKGRPANVKVGDSVEADEADEGWAPFALKAPCKMFKEPKLDAEVITLPAGTVIVFNNAMEMAFYYYDMDDKAWIYLIGQDMKVIGWMEAEDWKEKTSWEQEEK